MKRIMVIVICLSLTLGCTTTGAVAIVGITAVSIVSLVAIHKGADPPKIMDKIPTK